MICRQPCLRKKKDTLPACSDLYIPVRPGHSFLFLFDQRAAISLVPFTMSTQQFTLMFTSRTCAGIFREPFPSRGLNATQDALIDATVDLLETRSLHSTTLQLGTSSTDHSTMLASLPNELLFDIGSRVPERHSVTKHALESANLAALSQVSRHLRAIALPELYREVVVTSEAQLCALENAPLQLLAHIRYV